MCEGALGIRKGMVAMRQILIGIVLLGTGVMLRPGAAAEPPAAAGAEASPAASIERGPLHRRRFEHHPDEGTREMLEQVLMARLSKELALDDEQTVLLVRRFAEQRERMRDLRAQRGELVRELKAAVRTSKDGPSIEARLEAVIAQDQQIAAAQKDSLDLLGGDLTAWQRARLYLFIGEFQNEMRQLLYKARERGRGPRDIDQGLRGGRARGPEALGGRRGAGPGGPGMRPRPEEPLPPPVPVPEAAPVSEVEAPEPALKAPGQ